MVLIDRLSATFPHRDRLAACEDWAHESDRGQRIVENVERSLSAAYVTFDVAELFCRQLGPILGDDPRTEAKLETRIAEGIDKPNAFCCLGAALPVDGNTQLSRLVTVTDYLWAKHRRRPDPVAIAEAQDYWESQRAAVRSSAAESLELRGQRGDGLAYGASLIRLAGFLRVEGGAAILARWARDKHAAFDTLTHENEPIRGLILRTLLAWPGEERHDWWSDVFRDERYFDTAFRALAMRGVREGLGALPAYLQLAEDTDLNPALLEDHVIAFLHRHVVPYHLPDLWRVVTHLPPDQQQVVRDLVGRRLPEAHGGAAVELPVG